jgi:hypothetical protein
MAFGLLEGIATLAGLESLFGGGGGGGYTMPRQARQMFKMGKQMMPLTMSDPWNWRAQALAANMGAGINQQFADTMGELASQGLTPSAMPQLENMRIGQVMSIFPQAMEFGRQDQMNTAQLAHSFMSSGLGGVSMQQPAGGGSFADMLFRLSHAQGMRQRQQQGTQNWENFLGTLTDRLGLGAPGNEVRGAVGGANLVRPPGFNLNFEGNIFDRGRGGFGVRGFGS